MSFPHCPIAIKQRPNENLIFKERKKECFSWLMRKRENTAPERLFRRLWHILRWMLAQYNPRFSCPRCESKARVVVSGREEGRRTYRCLGCYIKFDAHGGRYPWRNNRSVKKP